MTSAHTGRIPLSAPSLGAREAAYLAECIDDGWVGPQGPFVRRFEAMFAARLGVSEAVSTASGTAALHVALAAFGVGPGDEVIVPALTFVATVNPVLYLGATPVFADVDPDTYCLDASAVQEALSPRTKAIIPVHLFGHPADVDALSELVAGREVVIFEDATEALGSSLHGRACGTLGDAAAFSFNSNKVITSGGGGMLVAGDPDRLERMRLLTLQGRVPGSIEYLHEVVGFNYTLSNLHSAVGLAQLERLDDLVAARRAIAGRYRAGLEGIEDLQFSPEIDGCRSNFWLMSVLVDETIAGRTRHEIQERLDRAGIEARPFFYPVPDLPPYAGFRAHTPVSRRLHRQGLCLPSSASLSESEQDRVVSILRG